MATGSIHFVDGIRIPADVFNLAGYVHWACSADFPQTGSVSFLGGDIEVDMSPEEINTHNKVKSAVTVGLALFAEKSDCGEILSDGALLVSEVADLATEPDAMLIRWETLQSGEVVYQADENDPRRLMKVLGAPDLVVEVVSRYSVRKDTKRLPEAYFRAGVREYWLIDARAAVVDFQVLTRASRKYTPAAKDRRGFISSEILGAKVKLERSKNRVGGDAYRLRIE